jgi:arylformamidase
MNLVEFITEQGREPEIIDITFPLHPEFVFWPGSIGMQRTWHMTMPSETNNLSSLVLDSHGGTHIDAPLHFVDQAKTIDQLDLSKMVGLCFVQEIRGVKSISAEVLESLNIPRQVTRLLLKTDNQKNWETNRRDFDYDFCSIDPSGAEWLVNRGVEFIGIDYLSIQRYHDPITTHQILLENEVVVAETLKLDQTETGWYYLVCSPLFVVGGEGAPARILLLK